MGLFNRKKRKEVIDERTDIEKRFEEAGQVAGKKTGVFVQKSIDKIEGVKIKVHADDKIEKIKKFAAKTEDKIDDLVGKATKVSKKTYKKVKEKVGK